MHYAMYDFTAHGLYNGLDEYELSDMVQKIAEEFGLCSFDYDVRTIGQRLSRDKDIIAAAEQTYTPFSSSPAWGIAYKESWEKLCAENRAPGEGNVSDGLVEDKVREMVLEIYQAVVVPRQEKERKKEEQRKEILSHVASIDTIEHKIYVGGGATEEFIHTVTMLSGAIYKFLDRNAFDAERCLTYEGKLLFYTDNKLYWEAFEKERGWVCVETSDSDEAVQAYKAAKLFGFANGVIRT